MVYSNNVIWHKNEMVYFFIEKCGWKPDPSTTYCVVFLVYNSDQRKINHDCTIQNSLCF